MLLAHNVGWLVSRARTTACPRVLARQLAAGVHRPAAMSEPTAKRPKGRLVEIAVVQGVPDGASPRSRPPRPRLYPQRSKPCPANCGMPPGAHPSLSPNMPPALYPQTGVPTNRRRIPNHSHLFLAPLSHIFRLHPPLPPLSKPSAQVTRDSRACPTSKRPSCGPRT